MRTTPIILVCAALAACGKKDAPGAGGEGAVIQVDGSSTVFPITEAVAEEFRAGGDQTKVTIGVSGTGGGFKKFCAGETVIANASRPIKPSEVEACQKSGIDFVELPIAYDGIAVVVSPENTWVDHLTSDELKKLWEPEAQGKVARWSHVRAGFPDEEVHLFGPGVDSGTYDYFTAAVNGKEHASRGDYTSSEDDNVLVQGVSTDRLALGYFGFAYYVENKARLKVIPIAHAGKPPVTPSLETVGDGTYQPLSRPIFIYVSKTAAERPEVQRFVDFYLKNAGTLSKEVGYIPLPDRAYELAAKRFADRVLGSVFGGKGSTIGVTVEQLLGGGT